MDEKIKEIEDCLSKIVYEEKSYGGRHLLKDDGQAWMAYHKLLKNADVWIKLLLSHIKDANEKVEWADGAVKAQHEAIVNLNDRIKQLEEGINKHRNTKIESNYKIEQMELRDEELYELVKRG